MKKLAFFVLAVVFLLASFCLAGCGSPGKPISIDSSLAARELGAGMVYGKDFTMDDDYMATSVLTFNCSQLSVENGAVDFELENNPSVYAPYFMWICYPAADDGRLTLICLEDVGGNLKESGDFVVLGVVQEDINKRLLEKR